MDNGYLYHYTNIETLALILKNHTIRFNSLDKMDDLQEQETSDLKNAGQFCYVSCWTDDINESIPMWNMYTSISSGVRIRLKKCPFKLHDNTAEGLQQVINAHVDDGLNGTPLKSMIPLSDMIQNGYMCPTAMLKDIFKILHKVEYSDDKEKLYPKLVDLGEKDISISLGTLGKYKNKHWSFQNEWRYILCLYPLNLNQSPERILQDSMIMANKIVYGIEKQPFPFYDMVIDNNAFSEMEITLSPKISLGNKIIVKSLVEKYNPTATIKDSALIGLL